MPAVPPAPRLTDAAVDHLDGRPLLLRASPRLGCCGGQALVPVAEVGAPDRPDDFDRITVGGVACFVDRRFGDEVAGWTVDAAGFARWRRLQLEGAQGLDPAATPHPHERHVHHEHDGHSEPRPG